MTDLKENPDNVIINRFKDSRFQLRVLVWICAVVMAVNFVYVPWVYLCKKGNNSAVIVQAGYWPIHDPPTIEQIPSYEKERELEKLINKSYKRYCSVYIDKYRIFFQTLVILVLFGAAYYTVTSLKN